MKYTYNLNGLKFASEEELNEDEQQEVFDTFQRQQLETQQQQNIVKEPESKLEDVDEIILKETKYDSIFKEVGKEYNINPQLLKSIAKQESNFDPSAEGEDGEIGMMQLMPVISNKYIPNQNPNDPRNNVIGAAKFLQHLKKKYNNDPNKVLQAYNGGETLLDKNPMGVKQTQDYRDSVLKNISAAQPFKQQKQAQPIVGSATPVEQQEPVTNTFKIKYNDLYKNQDYFDRVEDYMVFRFGKDYEYDKKEESKKEYVRKFATHIREVYYNNIDLTQEVLWTSKANKAQRTAAGYAFTLWEAIPIIDGGYNKFEAFADIANALAFDPMTYFGAIAGKAVSVAGSKTALSLARKQLNQKTLLKNLKPGLKNKAKRTEIKNKIKEVDKQLKSHVRQNRIAQFSTGFGVEGLFGSYAGGLDEALAVQQYRKETFDKSNIVLRGVVTGALGGVSTLPGIFFSKELKNAEKTVKEFEKKINKGKSVTNKDPALKELERQLSKTDEQIAKVYNADPNAGRLVIDKLSTEKNKLLQSQVHNKLFPVAVRIAGHIIKSDPTTYVPKIDRSGKAKILVGGKLKNISTAVNEVIGNLGKLDALTIEQAAVRAGVDPDTYTKSVQNNLLDVLKKYDITPEEFSKAMNTSVSDSAKIFQPYSYVSNLTRAMAGTDKKAREFMETVYTEQFNASPVSTIFNAFHTLERTSKIWVTSALSTTSLNVMGGLGALTMKTAANVFESIFQRAIRGVAVSMGADPTVLKIQEPKSIGDIFATWGKLANYGMTSLEADAILKFNPTIKNRLINTLAIGEGEDKLNAVNRFLASLNLAQDALFRKSAFVASVESELKYLGKDLYKDYLKNDIPIPKEVLEKATEDAMRATFSFQFGANKSAKIDDTIIEARGNNIARGFINFFENTPFVSLAIAFPRFMANAINYQYRFSPIGGASGMYDTLSGLLGKRYFGVGGKLTDDQRAALIKKGTEATARGAVGSTALYMAYQYRMQPENRSRDWWDLKIGDATFDARAFFPVAPYFAMAELLIRMFDLAKDSDVKTLDTSVEAVLESVAGLKAKDLDLFPDSLLRAFQDLKDGTFFEMGLTRFAETFFNFGGRFLQPIKPIREYLDGLSYEGLMARDPKDIGVDIYTGEKDGNVLIESLSNQVKNKLPDVVDNYGKDSLEKAVSYFRQGAPSGAGRFYSNFMGIKMTPDQNKIEKEITRLGIVPWRMEVYKPIGIKAFDNVVISNGLYFMENEVLNLMKTETYKKSTDNTKKRLLKKEISKAFTSAKDRLKIDGVDKRDGSVISEDLIKLNNYIDYKQLSKALRKEIEEKYQQMHPENKELSETKEFGKALMIKDSLINL